MITRLTLAAAAAYLVAAPAVAETRTSSNLVQLAQAQSTDDAKPARRSRRRDGAKKEPTVGQMATRERQKKCAAEWKEAKAGGKVASGMKWPKYWSQCNARLKGKEV
jgi:hypothetical protein